MMNTYKVFIGGIFLLAPFVLGSCEKEQGEDLAGHTDWGLVGVALDDKARELAASVPFKEYIVVIRSDTKKFKDIYFSSKEKAAYLDSLLDIPLDGSPERAKEYLNAVGYSEQGFREWVDLAKSKYGQLLQHPMLKDKSEHEIDILVGRAFDLLEDRTTKTSTVPFSK